MSFRDKLGRFTKFDKRKKIYDEDGELVYNPHPKVDKPAKPSNFEKAQPTHKEGKKELPIGARAPKARYESSVLLSDRTKDKDLYTYMADKRINQTVEKLKKRFPKQVITASVKVRIGNRKFETRTFKLTDIPKDREAHFIGGKRKGKKYTPKDIVAYFVHDRINDTDFTLYKKATDTKKQIKCKGKRKRYDKRQSFEVNFRVVSKTTGKVIPSVANFPKVKKGRAFSVESVEQSGRRKVSRIGRKRR